MTVKEEIKERMRAEFDTQGITTTAKSILRLLYFLAGKIDELKEEIERNG